MIFAQQMPVPMNRYEMWVMIAGIVANLILAIRSGVKAAEAAGKAGIAVDKANGLEAKVDDVRLTIDGGLKELLNTIRQEGHAAGVKAERLRASVLSDATSAGPTDRQPGAGV